MMYTRLYTHLEFHNILAPEQFGFRMHHSTEQATFSLIDCLLSALNEKQVVGGIFCDLHKAFDSVQHKMLLEKL
jgi:hypothetical protein